MADAGLMDDATRAKAMLINEIQRDDRSRGGQVVSPNLKDRGDERLFRGAKEAIKQGYIYNRSDIDAIADKLSAKQAEELYALLSGPEATASRLIPVGPEPDLSTTDDTIGSIPEFRPEGSPPMAEPWTPDMMEGPDWGGGAIPRAIGDWFRENVDIGFGPGPTGGRGALPSNGRTPIPPSDFEEDFGMPPDVGMPPQPDAPSPSLGGQLADDRLAGSPVPAPPPAEVPAEDPIIEIAGSASTKDEALAIADEAEASGLFPGARAKVMKFFGWDEEGAQDFGRALMGFGSGLLQGGPDFGAALGAGFAKGADAFVDAKDDRRQAALDDRRIAMEDERLDMQREEMNEKRKQAALGRLQGEAEATGSGLIYYEDGEGRIRSRAAPLADGPQDAESQTDLERYDYWMAMPEDTPLAIESKKALGRKWGFVEETSADPLIPVQ